MKTEGSTGNKRVRGPRRANLEIRARTKSRFRAITGLSGHLFNNFKALKVK